MVSASGGSVNFLPETVRQAKDSGSCAEAVWIASTANTAATMAAAISAAQPAAGKGGRDIGCGMRRNPAESLEAAAASAIRGRLWWKWERSIIVSSGGVSGAARSRPHLSRARVTSC